MTRTHQIFSCFSSVALRVVVFSVNQSFSLIQNNISLISMFQGNNKQTRGFSAFAQIYLMLMQECDVQPELCVYCSEICWIPSADFLPA